MLENLVIPLAGPYASNALLAIFLDKMLRLAKSALKVLRLLRISLNVKYVKRGHLPQTRALLNAKHANLDILRRQVQRHVSLVLRGSIASLSAAESASRVKLEVTP